MRLRVFRYQHKLSNTFGLTMSFLNFGRNSSPLNFRGITLTVHLGRKEIRWQLAHLTDRRT